MPKKNKGKTNTNGTTKVVMYLRYSSMHQKSVSLDEQRLANMKYCQENNYICIKEYSDAALSGKTDHRPAFQQMIKDAMNSPQFSKIVVYDLTRFSRKEADFARYTNMLSDRNIQVVSATQYFDASSAGRFQRRVMYAVSEHEVDVLTERVVRGLKFNAENGDHTGGKPPYGFELVNKKLEIDPRTKGAVQMLFVMFNLGFTYAEIAEKLYNSGYRSTSDDYRFKKSTLNAMLKNEKYMGTYTYNKANGKNSEGRRTVFQKKDPEEIIRVPGGCPAIVSEQLFDSVQKRLATNSAAQKSKTFHVLSGNDLLTCQCCGKKMRGNIKYSGRNQTEYKTYVCNGHRDKKKICPTKDIQTQYVDDFVLGKLQALLFNGKMTEHLLRLLNRAEYTTKADVKEKIATCQHELDKTKKQIKNLIDMIKKSGSNEEISKEMAQLSYEKKKLEVELENLKASKPVRLYTERDIAMLKELFVDYLKQYDTVVTRMFLQDVVENITVGNEEIEVVLNVA